MYFIGKTEKLEVPMRKSYALEPVAACRYQKKDKGVNSYKDAIYLGPQKDFTVVAGVLKRYEGAATIAYVPWGVVEIGIGAFAGYDKLTEVILPATVTTISESAFNGCDALKEVKIPKGVTSIKTKAFYGCTSLSKIEFEKSDEALHIGDSAFRMCMSLKELKTDRNIEYVGRYAFAECFALAEVNLKHRDQIYLAEGAFKNCTGLKKVSFMSVVSFKPPVLENCKNDDNKYSKKLKYVVLNSKTRLKKSLCCGANVSLVGKRCQKCHMKFVKRVI